MKMMKQLLLKNICMCISKIYKWKTSAATAITDIKETLHILFFSIYYLHYEKSQWIEMILFSINSYIFFLNFI